MGDRKCRSVILNVDDWNVAEVYDKNGLVRNTTELFYKNLSGL